MDWTRSVKAARLPTKLVEGMKVRYLPQPEWGTGHLVRLHEAGLRAQVSFPGREGNPTLVSTKGGALVAQRLLPGDAVRTSKGKPATIVGEVQGARGLRRYVLRFEDGTEDEWPESEIQVPPPKPDALTMLREGRVGDAKNFLLRRQALMLDDERRCDALGALFASRVMVKPHQVGVVQGTERAAASIHSRGRSGAGKDDRGGNDFLRASPFRAGQASAGGCAQSPHHPVAGGAVSQIQSVVHLPRSGSFRALAQGRTRTVSLDALRPYDHQPGNALSRRRASTASIVPRGVLGSGDLR